MILPRYNLSVIDVQKALGTSNNNVGALCTSDRILPWSKYKPIHSSDIIYDITAGSNFRGSNNDCDITFVHASSIQEVLNKVSQDKSSKLVKIPAAMPKRLGDFRWYNNEAKQPWMDKMLDLVYSKNNEQASPVTFRYKPDINVDYNLTYSLLFPSYKVAVVVADSLGRFSCLVSAVKTLGESSNELNLIPSSQHWNKEDTYICYPVLINKNDYTFQPNINAVMSNDFILLDIQPFRMKFYTPSMLRLNVVIDQSSLDTVNGGFAFDVLWTNQSGKNYTCMFMDIEITEEIWDEELNDIIGGVTKQWREDLQGVPMNNGEVDYDPRLGGYLDIPNYNPDCSYYIQATLRLMENVDDVVSPRELIF